MIFIISILLQITFKINSDSELLPLSYPSLAILNLNNASFHETKRISGSIN